MINPFKPFNFLLCAFRPHPYQPICNVYMKNRNRAKLLRGLYQCERCKLLKKGAPIKEHDSYHLDLMEP